MSFDDGRIPSTDDVGVMDEASAFDLEGRLLLTRVIHLVARLAFDGGRMHPLELPPTADFHCRVNH